MATDPGGDNVLPFFPSKRPAIALDRITVCRGARTVLQDVALAIADGTITAVVGPSGAGKSTLLGVLNGLIVPAAGTLFAAGIGRLDDTARVREHQRRTATVFQEHALIDRLSALDNVLLGLADRRHPLSLLPWPETARLRAAGALAHVGLLHLAHRRVGRLSGGERQRVGFARALVRRPRLLLADEPFAAVDPTLLRHLADTLRRAVTADRVTLVIVLHQIELARALADRIVGLRDGRIGFIGSPNDFDKTEEECLFRPPTTNEKRNGCSNA